MAEGDTVHRIAGRLSGALVGETVADAHAPDPRSPLARAAGRLRGKRVERVEARGKHLLVHLSEGLALHSHLGMNGSWHLYPRGVSWRRPRRSAWLVIATGAVEAAQFGGARLRLLGARQLAVDPRLRSLGPDLLAAGFDPAVGVAALRSAAADRSLGEVLLDQRIVAGLGNIYKSEGCFAAGVDPWRRLATLDDDELRRVIVESERLMRGGLESGRPPRRVYGKGGRPCPRCSSPIRSRGQGDANRTTYWCERCQS